MTQAPPVPQASQSPYPASAPAAAAPTATSDANALTDVVDNARDTIAPLQERATSFAKARPWATAALVGTVAMALLGTLRGRNGTGKAR